MAWASVCPLHCYIVSPNFFTVGCPKDSTLSWRNLLPLGEGIPLERGRQKGSPLKDAILTPLTLLVWKRLQIGTHTLLIITSTGDGLFSFINTDDLERPWTSQKKVFANFSQSLVAAHISRVNCNEVAGDRPRQPAYEIFSIKRRFYSSLSADPLGSRRPSHASVKKKHPSKKWLFYWYCLV